MSDPTDEELVRAVAEIEGGYWTDHETLGSCIYEYDRDSGEYTYTQWSPLTNSNDLVELIKKYSVTTMALAHDRHGRWYGYWSCWAEQGGAAPARDKSLERAVLKAIIEANR